MERGFARRSEALLEFPLVAKAARTTEHGPVAQLVSAPPCHGGGRGFKSRRGRSGRVSSDDYSSEDAVIAYLKVNTQGSVAQLVERTTENRKVTGSTPVGATIRPPGFYSGGGFFL